MNWKRTLTFIIALALVFSMIMQASGETVNDLKKQQEKIQKEIENTKKEILAMQKETKNLDNQIKELDLKVSNAASELGSVEKELEILNIEIENTMDTLKTAEENIVSKTETFNQRLRVMYKNGNAGYLEVLLSSENIKDFLSRQEMIQSIADYDKELII